MPPPAQPNMPGGPPPDSDILAVLSEPGNEDILSMVLSALSPADQQALPSMPVPERNAMLGPILQQLMQELQQQQAQQTAPVQTAPPNPPPMMGGPNGPAPMPGPGDMPPGGPPPGALPPPPPQPIAPQGPPQPGGPSASPEEPDQPKQADYLAEVDDEEKTLPPPDDWEPEPFEFLYGKDYAWRDKPTHEEICKLAAEALEDTFWQERNQACYDQSYCYYRSRQWIKKFNNLPANLFNGDLVYILSTPTKQVDRIVARTQPHAANLNFVLDARSELDEYTEAQQNVENFARDLWRKLCQAWRKNMAQTRAGATLERSVSQLPTLHGTAGYSLRPDIRVRKGSRKRDINAYNPIQIDVIPQHELYLLGDITLRIQSVTLKEARRLSAEVRRRWPSRAKGEKDTVGAKWQPSDDHPTRLISGSDIHGKWYFQCFDVCKPEGKDDEEGTHWTIPPEEINFGRCLFQLPPGWQSTADNALPDDRQPAENYGRNFARGALFANLEDFAYQDMAASASITAFAYNRDPAFVEKVNYKLRQDAGQPLPDDMKVSQGARNQRDVSEGGEFIPKHFADTPADNFFLSLSFGQTADTFPAALGGGGAAQSGYDRRQMVENAQLLHVEEIRNYVAQWVEQVIQDCLELAYRCGTSKKPTFSELPFRMSKGGVGEGRLTMRDIERAGIDVQVSYVEEDMEAELRKNNIYLPRLQAGVLSRKTTRDKLSVAEPDAEEEQVDAEFALTHPSMQMARAMLVLSRRLHPLLPFLREAAQMEALQKQQGGPPGQPGMPSIAGGPPGGLETGARGMPPGQPMPPGL